MRSVIISTIIISLAAIFPGSQVFALSEADVQSIGSKYGVSPHLLRAISIVESREGKLTGKYKVEKHVSKKQHKFLRKIARHTGRELDEFKGSYGGAMGYMQIIPSTFHAYAQDGNEDGIKDPLNDYDSLATAAYFISRTLAVKKNLKALLKSYNNDSAYCEKVTGIYQKLRIKSKVASQQVSPK